MKITVIGAGAIGLLFAAKLTQLGHNVHLITRQKDQSDDLKANGIALHADQNTNWSDVTASSYIEREKESDCYIVTVKQYQLSLLYPSLSSLPVTVPIIFIQNGMSHLKMAENLPHHHVFVSTVEHGAERLSKNAVLHNGVGKWKIAAVKGKSEAISFFAEKRADSFPIEFHDDYYALLAEKLVKNTLINSLTALFDVKNGELITNPHLHKLLHSLYDEVMQVFFDLRDSLSFDVIESLCKSTAANSSSMRTDVSLNRPTEVEAIIGYTLEKGRKMKIKLPLLNFIYDSILAIEYREGIRH
ncbi:2-dehydropantoate 2-reductase [Jeotgalibacillus campisalis]|uniref:2-dehydropantoate 2-reductase n=1 Tax=Jeotgalibacillus campisalis TaxID=220754 RepID=A0A0C2VFE8_9BACL|nr:2-dehydropantoate 2-reductase [Jeotgalibacillus campisalis]KIL47617.1 2-dehydropantoate 2-reductase [Jeotgalibacillus campisalis]